MKEIGIVLFIVVMVIGVVFGLISCVEYMHDPKSVHDGTSCCNYMTFDGHLYVKWESGYHGGIAHAPNCPCKTNTVTKTSNLE